MIELFKKMIKCRLQGRYKINVISGKCVRCQYNRNEANEVAQAA